MSIKAICLDTAIPEVREVLTKLDEYIRGETTAPDAARMKSMLDNMINRLELSREQTVEVYVCSENDTVLHEQLKLSKHELLEFQSRLSSLIEWRRGSVFDSNPEER